MTKIKKVQDVTTLAANDQVYELPGMDPKILVEAALAACALKTTKEILKRDNIEFDEEELYAEATGTLSESPKRFADFDVSIVVPNLPEDYDQEKMMVSIERACIIGNTLKNEASVTFHKKA